MALSWATSAWPLVSTTCVPSRLPLWWMTANVVLAACTSNPIYVFIRVLSFRGCFCQQRKRGHRQGRTPTCLHVPHHRGESPWVVVCHNEQQPNPRRPHDPGTRAATARRSTAPCASTLMARGARRAQNGAVLGCGCGRHVPMMLTPVRKGRVTRCPLHARVQACPRGHAQPNAQGRLAT